MFRCISTKAEIDSFVGKLRLKEHDIMEVIASIKDENIKIKSKETERSILFEKKPITDEEL